MDSGPRRKDGVRSGGALPVMKGYGRQKEPPLSGWGFFSFLWFVDSRDGTVSPRYRNNRSTSRFSASLGCGRLLYLGGDRQRRTGAAVLAA